MAKKVLVLSNPNLVMICLFTTLKFAEAISKRENR